MFIENTHTHTHTHVQTQYITSKYNSFRSLVNGITSFMGNLMPKQFLQNSSDTI